MTQPSTYQVHASASLQVRALVLPRTVWESTPTGRGAMLRPVRGTWYGHVVRGKSAHDVTTIAMVACPTCNGIGYLSHNEQAAKVLAHWFGQPKVPVAHRIDHLGKVSTLTGGDYQCMHARCDFHRALYLDRWNKTKALFALAYVDLRKSVTSRKIEIAYSHAIDAREAIFHLGLGPKHAHIIASGPAIGFYVDEKTGRMTADA